MNRIRFGMSLVCVLAMAMSACAYKTSLKSPSQIAAEKEKEERKAKGKKIVDFPMPQDKDSGVFTPSPQGGARVGVVSEDGQQAPEDKYK